MPAERSCQFCGLVPKPGEPMCQSAEDADFSCKHVSIIQSGPLAGLKRGHYRAIYADPAWTYQTFSDKGKDRSPETHYECMSIDEIKALPVKEIAAKDCILFMWIIDTHAEMAFEVLKAWGFTYKTKGFTWVKLNAVDPKAPKAVDDASAYFTGMGHWTRANPEDCLLATKGKPSRKEDGKGVRRLIVAERREHSRKPDEVYGRIEALVPGPYVELFSRAGRPGWDAMGNEVGKFPTVADLSAEELVDIEGLI